MCPSSYDSDTWILLEWSLCCFSVTGVLQLLQSIAYGEATYALVLFFLLYDARTHHDSRTSDSPHVFDTDITDLKNKLSSLHLQRGATKYGVFSCIFWIFTVGAAWVRCFTKLEKKCIETPMAGEDLCKIMVKFIIPLVDPNCHIRIGFLVQFLFILKEAFPSIERLFACEVLLLVFIFYFPFEGSFFFLFPKCNSLLNDEFNGRYITYTSQYIDRKAARFCSSLLKA